MVVVAVGAVVITVMVMVVEVAVIMIMAGRRLSTVVRPKVRPKINRHRRHHRRLRRLHRFPPKRSPLGNLLLTLFPPFAPLLLLGPRLATCHYHRQPDRRAAKGATAVVHRRVLLIHPRLRLHLHGRTSLSLLGSSRSLVAHYPRLQLALCKV